MSVKDKKGLNILIISFDDKHKNLLTLRRKLDKLSKHPSKPFIYHISVGKSDCHLYINQILVEKEEIGVKDGKTQYLSEYDSYVKRVSNVNRLFNIIIYYGHSGGANIGRWGRKPDMVIADFINPLRNHGLYAGLFVYESCYMGTVIPFIETYDIAMYTIGASGPYWSRSLLAYSEFLTILENNDEIGMQDWLNMYYKKYTPDYHCYIIIRNKYVLRLMNYVSKIDFRELKKSDFTFTKFDEDKNYYDMSKIFNTKEFSDFLSKLIVYGEKCKLYIEKRGYEQYENEFKKNRYYQILSEESKEVYRTNLL